MKLLLCTLLALPVICAANEILAQPLEAAIVQLDARPVSTAEESQFRALFATDSTALSSAAKSALNPLIKKHRYSASHEFLLAGHADSRGPRNYNMLLSMRRVKAVKSYLIEQGVRPERIRTQAYGESRAAINVRDTRALIFDRQVVVTVKAKTISAEQLATKDL